MLEKSKVLHAGASLEASQTSMKQSFCENN